MAEAELVTLTDADLPELAALCAATLPFDDCSPSLLHYTLLLSTEAEPMLPLGLREGGRLVAFAVGTLGPGHDGALAGYIKLVATAPDAQRRGFARRLIGELEERFRAAGAATGCVMFSRRYFVPGVDLRHSRALCLLDRLGYARVAMTYNLDVDLTRRSFDPAPLVAQLRADGVTVRRLARADEAAYTRYLGERWSEGWQYEGLHALRSGQEPIPAHVALAGEEIIGFAAYDVTRPGWFGPIGTNAERRGRRVGTALLHACLHDWQRQGRRHCQIAGIGPLYFYVDACDAVIERAFQIYQKSLAAEAAGAGAAE